MNAEARKALEERIAEAFESYEQAGFPATPLGKVEPSHKVSAAALVASWEREQGSAAGGREPCPCGHPIRGHSHHSGSCPADRPAPHRAAATGEQGSAPHIRRVKVDELIVAELATESAPVTVRIETEADGDLQLVFTRHDCAPTSGGNAG
jgi:hypothetical protein